MTSYMTVLEGLRSHPFLAGFPERILTKLAEIAREVTFEADEIIFREGDGRDVFYLIVSGSVSIEIHSLGRTLRVQTLREGEELGWSSALPASRKYFQARALRRVRAIAFEGSALRNLFEKDYELGYRFCHALLGVVAERIQATQLQLADLCETAQPAKL
jgi:CRP-like cAMP-binding protein